MHELVLVLERVMMTVVHLCSKVHRFDRFELTIACFRSVYDVPFHHEMLKTGPFGQIHQGEGKVADSIWPETLESLRILAPCLDEDVETRTTINVRRFEKS